MFEILNLRITYAAMHKFCACPTFGQCGGRAIGQQKDGPFSQSFPFSAMHDLYLLKDEQLNKHKICAEVA